MSDLEHTKDNEIWKGKDYVGRIVMLYVNERDHILSGHPVMSNSFTAVYDTVQSPESVYRAAEIPCREVFFKRSSQAEYNPRLYTKAIVEYNTENTEGFIVTAFPKDKEDGNIGEKLYPE